MNTASSLLPSSPSSPSTLTRFFHRKIYSAAVQIPVRMIPSNPLSVALLFLAGGLLFLRALLSFKSLLYCCWRWLVDLPHDYQCFHIPRYEESSLENHLYRHAAAYVASLPSVELAPAVAVFSSGRRLNDLSFLPSAGHPVADCFLGSRLSWSTSPAGLVLRLRRQDRACVLRPYLQRVESVGRKVLGLRRCETKLFINSSGSAGGDGQPVWKMAAPFTHPATIDTVVMDPENKDRVRADLEAFVSGQEFYHRVGRIWRRSYLLHGPPGTGKSTFAAAMANFLRYDVYKLDLAAVSDGGALKALLLCTSPQAMILVEDIDRHLKTKNGEVLDMEEVFLCYGEERVMVFTAEGPLEPSLLRPGPFDVCVPFPMCDFPAFKTLASGYLGLSGHRLFPEVEEAFRAAGERISPAEVSEIMIANRGAPSRALKSLINELRRRPPPAKPTGQKHEGSCSRGGAPGPEKDSAAAARELKKWCALIKGRKKNGGMPAEVAVAAAAAAVTPLGKLEKDSY